MSSILGFLSWSIPTATLVTAMLLQSGCSLAPSPYDEHAVVAVFPANGAASVPLNTPIRVELGWSNDADTLDAVLTDEYGVAQALSCERIGDDAHWMKCPTEGGLEAETTYTLRVGNDLATSTFTTASPAGAGYEIGSGLRVEAFGSQDAAADQMTNLLADAGPMVMVAETTDAWSEIWHWGPGKSLPAAATADYAAKAAVGYPVALDVTTDGDRFHGWADHAYFPLTLDGSWHYVRLDEVTVTGVYQSGSDAIAEMEVEAIVTSTSILRVADLLEDDIADLMIALCRPDLDTDGDGEDDAATFRFVTFGTPAKVH